MKYLSFVIILAVPCTASAQPELFLPMNVDVRSMSMGRTSILTPEGSNAIFSNPAVLATLDNMQVQGGGRMFFGGVAAGDDENVETATFPRHTRFLDHLSFAMPYALADSTLHLAFGVGYHSYYDFGYNVGDEEADVLLASHGGLNMISPAAAISYQGKYFAGLSIHKSVRSDITTEYEAFDLEEEVETSGSFLLVGALAHIKPGITLGGMYRSGFEWEWERENGATIDREHPALWGLGASFRLSRRWILVSEYRSLPFSNYVISGVKVDVDDGFGLRVGFEKGGNIPFRFGFFRDAIPEHDFDADDPKYLTGATIGLGFPITSIRINLGGEGGYWLQEIRDDVLMAQVLFRFRFSAQYRFGTD